MTPPPSMETSAGPGHRFTQQQCSSCDSSSARCWCLDCDEALCDVCVSAHRRVTLTRSHQILNQPPAGDVSTPPTKFCRLHPSEPLKLFCFTCNQLTCRDCQLMDHMNHRYQFVNEALSSMKKQLEAWTQPIRAHSDTVRQSLLDMETRHQDIIHCESKLRVELQQSYEVLVLYLKKRMQEILNKIKKVMESEHEVIQRRRTMLKQLLKNQQSVTETADKAKNSNDLSALLTYMSLVKTQLKDLPDKNFSPPQTMSQMKVVTDRTSLEAILNFGKLEVSWIPFSVSQTSTQDSPATSTSSSPILQYLLRCSDSSHDPVPKTNTTNDSASPTPVSAPSSCPSINQSKALVTKTTVPKTAASPSSSTVKTLSHLEPKQRQALLHVLPSVNLQPVRFGLPLSAGVSSSCTVFKLVKPSSNLNQPTAHSQNQPASVLLSNTQAAYQVSCWPSHLPSAVPQFSVLRSQTVSCDLPGNTWPEQQKNCGSHQRLPVPATGNQIPVGPSQTALPSPTQASNHQPLEDLSCTATTSDPLPPSEGLISDISHHSSSLKHQQQSPVVKAAADSACDRSVQQVAMNQEPAENEPTSTVFEETEPAAKTPPPAETEAKTPPPAETEAKTPPPAETEPAAKTPPPAETEPAAKTPPPAETEPAAKTPPPAETEAKMSPPAETEAKTSPPAETEAKTSPPAETEAKTPPPAETEAKTPPPAETEAKTPPPAETEAKTSPPAETEPAAKTSPPAETEAKTPPPEVLDRHVKEESPVTGHPDYSLSQWQPSVPLVRLPVSRLCPGRPLPGFRLVPSDSKDDIYLEEMSEDTRSHADDIIIDLGSPLSSPESPVTLQIVSCSACGSASGSIICSACGRGYHRDCHDPPAGPAFWSEWICSLCQDLADPSDPYSSDRPHRPRLSLLDQRRCERLLLHLKVEGCSRLSERGVWSRVALISARLSGRRPPEYQTAVELLSDVWTLLTDASQDDEVLMDLQESLRNQLMETFGSELHPSLLKLLSPHSPPDTKTPGGHELTEVTEGSKVTLEEQELIPSESKLKIMRKRLREFMNLVGPGPKRAKTDNMD